MSIGVPIKVLHEAAGHIVTIETCTGEMYRGRLIDAEDNMNCQMREVIATFRDGRQAQLEYVYIRGSKINYLILPDMLKNAPMFKNVKGVKGGAGRGKSAILRAQAAARGRAYRGGRAGPAPVSRLSSKVVIEVFEIMKITMGFYTFLEVGREISQNQTAKPI
ncbi:hypothetical protein ACOME3_009141 [Neoechinorhynchus agilis]